MCQEGARSGAGEFPQKLRAEAFVYSSMSGSLSFVWYQGGAQEEQPRISTFPVLSLSKSLTSKERFPT